MKEQTGRISFLNLVQVTEKYWEEIDRVVSRVVKSGRYLLGEENERFEREYAAYIGTRFAVGCASGLDALTLIFRAYMEMGVMKRGDEVIVPANTFIATILAITENGLKPVLVEPKWDSLVIDDSCIEAFITERTKAVCIVHLYGRLAYSDRIGDVCKKYGLRLIEDNAQSHGCMTADGRKTGSLGDAAGHSFYPGKNMGALGDGGAVTTDDEVLALTVRSLANYGSSGKYLFKFCGRNSRLDEIQAAVLNVKLSHLEEDNAHRKEIACSYIENIDNPSVLLPQTMPSKSNVFHLFPVLCIRRDELQKYLSYNGVETLIHYPLPPHKQECYREWNGLSLPITERIAAEELSLPMGPAISIDEAAEVVRLINSFE